MNDNKHYPHSRSQERHHWGQTVEENEMEVAVSSHEILEEAFHHIDCVKELEAICSCSVGQPKDGGRDTCKPG